jgi:hypothetical protein
MAEVSADSLNRRGVELFLQGDHRGALLHYEAAVGMEQNFYPAMANMVAAMGDLEHLETARVLARRLLIIQPTDHLQRVNLGGILMRMERYEEALEELNKAAEQRADDAALWYNLALLHHRLGNETESLAAMDRVEALGHKNHNTENDRAHMLLAQGQSLQQALELYEARWHTMLHLPPWDYHVPEWQGQDLNGKTIMLHGEQGFGDTIMTIRFGKLCAERGARVVYCVPKAMVELMEAQEWVEHVVEMESMTNMDGVDYHSPLYSAMRWLGVEWDTIDSAPYLTAPRVTVPLVKPGINLGICWASGRRDDEAMNWRRRISHLRQWLFLAEDPEINLWSLQMGEESQQIEELGAGALVANPMHQITNWAQTAAFVKQLDLVVTVDTGIAHLAGAMGKRVCMISQFCPCWRWRGIGNGTGDPWYESMWIFKQPEPGDWDTPLAESRRAIAWQ